MLTFGDLLVAAAPALLWLVWVRHHDRHAPEPRHLVALTFGLGAAAACAVVAVRPWLDVTVEPHLLALPPQWQMAADCLLVTAPLEELLKGVALLPMLLHRQTDEPMDGIVHGAAAAMGFATVESALYVAMTGDPWIAAQRAFTAAVAHLACSSTMGFLLVAAKLRLRGGRRRSARRRLGQRPSTPHGALGRSSSPPLLALAAVVGAVMSCALLVPIVLHGIYDLLLAFGHGSFALLGLLPGMLLLLSAKIRWSRRAREQHA